MSDLQKITEQQMDAAGVCSAPDVLSGSTSENKAVFDKMVRQLVAPAYNAAVDAIEAINQTESGIQANEAKRAEAEAERAEAEAGRADAENARVRAEQDRTEAERARSDGEAARQEAENERKAAEQARAEGERDRMDAEAARQQAEQQRVDSTTGIVAQATGQAKAARDSAVLSQSWAVGETGTREGENTDNARYWAQQAHAAVGGGVVSFNGRSGAVVPQKTDYTAEMVGAIPQKEKGAPDGVASLDSGGKVLSAQLPELDFLKQSGGTMKGPLILSRDPAGEMEAVTKQYADKIKVDAYSKTETLSDETKTLYGLSAEAVPDDIFLLLLLGQGKKGYIITVQLEDGTPVPGSKITGLASLSGGELITGANGRTPLASGDQQVIISASSPYYDINEAQNVTVTGDQPVIEHTITLTSKSETKAEFRDSTVITLSPLIKTVDISCVGGGGGGGKITRDSDRDPIYSGGGGGGGGYVKDFMGLTNPATPLTITVGSGGSFGSSGGKSSVSGTGISASANGGHTGSTIQDGPDPYWSPGGDGNGKGGDGGNSSASGKGKNGENGSGRPFGSSSYPLVGGGGGGGTYNSSYSSSGGSPNGGQGGNYGNVGGFPGGGGGGQSNSSYNGGNGGNGVVYMIFHR